MIKRCAGNYISEDGKYVIYHSDWCKTWDLYEKGLKIGSFLTKKEATERIESIERGR